MAYEQVFLPMAGTRAVGDLGGALLDAHNILRGARRESDFTRPTNAVAPPQIPSEFSLAGSAGQHRKIGIDGFIRTAQRGIVSISLRQAVRNLFGEQRCASRCKTASQKRVDHERSRLTPLMRPAR